MPAFPGFPDDLLPFLSDLAEHNDRDWFEANKARYHAAWIEPARAFVTAATDALQAFDPAPTGAPKVNGSLFRLQRDTRFSADKTPYKTNLAMLFWYGSNKKTNPSLYLGLSPEEGCTLGVGMYGFDKAALARYRAAVAGPQGATLADAIDALTAEGWTTGGEQLKTAPRGVDPDHPRIALLRHKSLYLAVDGDLDAMHTPEAVAYAVSVWRTATPVAHWLLEHVGTG